MLLELDLAHGHDDDNEAQKDARGRSHREDDLEGRLAACDRALVKTFYFGH